MKIFCSAAFHGRHEKGSKYVSGPGKHNDKSEDLINIVTKQIAHDHVKKAVMQIGDIGLTHFQQYMNNRIKEPKEPVLQPMKKFKLSLLSTLPTKLSKLKCTSSSIRNDVKLFSRLYVGCEARVGDLDEFFRHENHAWSTSSRKIVT